MSDEPHKVDLIPPEKPEGPPDLLALPPDEREAAWYEHYYLPNRDKPQLTLRAVVTGAFLGMLMSLSNLYVGLKTGWALGVAITACILSFSIFKILQVINPKMRPMSVLENNCMQSTASSAGYSTGGTMVAGIAAYLMLTGQHMPWPVLTLWTMFLAGLGVFMAIPMKRQMIDVEQLRFPSGVAAAETLKSLHSAGGEAVAKARALGVSGVLASVWKVLLDLGKVPSAVNFLPGTFHGHPWASWTLQLDLSLIMVAAGAIVGMKVAWSMLLAAAINWAVLAPWMVSMGAITKVAYKPIVTWSTWTGTAIMVSSSLLMFALQWRTVLRALQGIASIFTGQKGDDRFAELEVPGHWFLIGVAVCGAGCVAILALSFGTNVFVGVVAVALSFILALVACRATGESDITPMGAMGKVAQLTFGVLAPSNMVTNLMTAGVTAGAASSSADLLTDLKSGYILGANPKKQFIAQFLGIFAGTLMVVPAFYILVPTAADLGGPKWPAPAAQVWKGVAELLAQGVSALHWTARSGLLIGLLVGLFLPILEMLAPKRLKPFIPSATGVGLAFVIPFFNSLSMFLGAFFAWAYHKVNPQGAERYIVPVASGIIAGESLMGILIALLTATGVLGGGH